MPEPGASALGFEVPSGGPGGRVSPDRASPREARGNAEASDVRRRAPAQTTEGRCVAWPWGGPKAAAAAAPAAAGAREGPLGRLSRDRGEEGGPAPFATLGETGNDPSAGSPTETLLRLLLPLDSQV